MFEHVVRFFPRPVDRLGGGRREAVARVDARRATVAPQHAHEDERQDGEATARDLGYDFQMLTRWIGSSGTW